MGIRAYHGSPYDFDRFDMSKIGTGEGAQGYGHGLYFADSPNVARTYQSKVSAMHGSDKPTIAGAPIDFDDPMQAAAFELARHNGDRLAAADFYEKTFRDSRVPRILRDNERLPKVKFPGRMYEVDINASPEQFLDWDKPLSTQGEIAARLERMAINPILKGSDAYQALGFDQKKLQHDFTGKLAASRLLKEAGIPGIRYLDQGSRSAGTGTRNYVVFDPKIVSILRKYGIAGAAAPPAFSALAQFMANTQGEE